MFWPSCTDFRLYLFDIMLLEAIVIYAWRFRKAPGAIPFLALQACKIAWLAFLTMSCFASGNEAKLFWLQWGESILIFLPYLWLLFIWQISRTEKKLPVFLKYGFLFIIFSLWLAMLFLPTCKLPWQGCPKELAFWGGQGPFYWLALSNTAALCLIDFLLCLRWLLSTAGLRRHQVLWFTTPVLFSLLGIILSHFPAFDFLAPLSTGFLLNAIFIAWAFYRFHVYSLLPAAHKAVSDHMIEGLLVVDKTGYIIEMNPAAHKILEDFPVRIGSRFETVIAGWPDLAKFAGQPTATAASGFLQVAAESRAYQFTRIPLQKSPGETIGCIFLLTDITQQKQCAAKLRQQQEALSILTERERLSRELHDGAGQMWSYIHMQIEAARSFLGKNAIQQATAILEKLAHHTQSVHVDLRESIAGLQSCADGQEFFQALAAYLEWFQECHGIPVTLHLAPSVTPKQITPMMGAQLLRILQEALTNIRKYAAAQTVQIDFQAAAGLLEILIADDGCGFDAAAAMKKRGSFGLKIMRERAADIDAHLHIQSGKNSGTRILVKIPLPPDTI